MFSFVLGIISAPLIYLAIYILYGIVADTLYDLSYDGYFTKLSSETRWNIARFRERVENT